MVANEYKRMMIESVEYLKAITAAFRDTLGSGNSDRVWDVLGATGDEEFYHLARCRIIAEFVPFLEKENYQSLMAIVGLCNEKAVATSERVAQLDKRIGLDRAIESRRIHALYRALNEVKRVARDEAQRLKTEGKV